MLKQRLITAFIFIPLFIAMLFWLPPVFFYCVTTSIALLGAWEWTALMQIKKPVLRWFYLEIILLSIIIAWFAIPFSLFLLVTFFWWIFVCFLVYYYPAKSNWWANSYFWRGLMGFMVLVPSVTTINFIRIENGGDGAFALLFLFILIWGADSTAYFVGKKWGKTKLAPNVSPGKSWQGLYGALIYTIIIAIVTLAVCHTQIEVWPWGIALSLVTVCFSVIGDLFESMLKRQAGVKDSSNLLPGHGGILDRIDSLTAAAPIFAFGAMLLTLYLD